MPDAEADGVRREVGLRRGADAGAGGAHDPGLARAAQGLQLRADGLVRRRAAQDEGRVPAPRRDLLAAGARLLGRRRDRVAAVAARPARRSASVRHRRGVRELHRPGAERLDARLLRLELRAAGVDTGALRPGPGLPLPTGHLAVLGRVRVGESPRDPRPPAVARLALLPEFGSVLLVAAV